MDVVVELGAVSPGTKAASREATAVRSTMAREPGVTTDGATICVSKTCLGINNP